MGDPRIIDVALDERSILWRSAEIEQERQIAALDLLRENHFAPARAYPDGYAGPFRVTLSVRDGRLAIAVASESGALLETVLLGLSRFRRLVRDYFAICDSYYRALKEATATHVETIDMARRAIHNEAAELLVDCLDGRIAIDFDTARRLFTLICVLHIKG